MRLAVLSDIHGNLLALQAVLADIEASGGADTTWILGDLVAFGPEPVACIHTIRALPGDKTAVIQGNTDRYVYTGQRPTWKKAEKPEEWATLVGMIRQRDLNFGWTTSAIGWEEAEYLIKLGTDLSLEAPGYGWVVGFHAAPGDDEYVLLPDTSPDELEDALLDREGRLALGGHTHRSMDRQDLETWRMVNPGSVGLPFDGDTRASYAMITFDGGEAQVQICRVPYDVEAVVARLEELQHPAREWTITRLRTAKAG